MHHEQLLGNHLCTASVRGALATPLTSPVSSPKLNPTICFL